MEKNKLARSCDISVLLILTWNTTRRYHSLARINFFLFMQKLTKQRKCAKMNKKKIVVKNLVL